MASFSDLISLMTILLKEVSVFELNSCVIFTHFDLRKIHFEIIEIVNSMDLDNCAWLILYKINKYNNLFHLQKYYLIV